MEIIRKAAEELKTRQQPPPVPEEGGGAPAVHKEEQAYPEVYPEEAGQVSDRSNYLHRRIFELLLSVARIAPCSRPVVLQHWQNSELINLLIAEQDECC